jgi:hypothetical protein
MSRDPPSNVRRLSALARLLSFVARLAVAFVLLTSPFWLLPHAGEAAYQFEAEQIEYEPGVAGYIRAGETIDRLPCYRFHERESLCLFAAHVAQNGPVTVNVSEGYGRDYDLPSEYVVVEDSGNDLPFYRWRVEGADHGESDRAARRTYSLEAVGTETILADVAVNATESSPEVRRMLDGETVTVYAGSPAGESFDRGVEILEASGDVVRSNGSYYLVTRAGRQRPDQTESDATVLRGAAVLLGVALLWRTWRGTRDAER